MEGKIKYTINSVIDSKLAHWFLSEEVLLEFYLLDECWPLTSSLSLVSILCSSSAVKIVDGSAMFFIFFLTEDGAIATLLSLFIYTGYRRSSSYFTMRGRGIHMVPLHLLILFLHIVFFITKCFCKSKSFIHPKSWDWHAFNIMVFWRLLKLICHVRYLIKLDILNH